MVNETFAQGGPTFTGGIFPFVFICIMCGAVSGFHALVSSGTTPKMIDKETQVRTIGYGAMLMESLVGVVALVAAAALPQDLYYGINVDPDKVKDYLPRLEVLYASQDPLHQVNVDSVQHLNVARAEELVGNEWLRGRTGGAVT